MQDQSMKKPLDISSLTSSAYEAISGPPSLSVKSKISSSPLIEKHSSSEIGVNEHFNSGCYLGGGVIGTSSSSTSSLSFWLCRTEKFS